MGSGSRGNALLIECRDTLILVDCGFSVRAIKQRMEQFDQHPRELDAIVITHEHADHIGSAARLSCKYDIPVWMTAGTFDVCRDSPFHELHTMHAHAEFELGDMLIRPFPVPHDAREPSQFVFDDGEHRLGLLTDTGSITPHIVRSLEGCEALMLECNYDPELMARGPYPASLKRRIASDYGHLSNQQAADLLARLDLSALKHLIAVHVSEQNNTPELALAALADGLGDRPEWLIAADQEKGFGGWIKI